MTSQITLLELRGTPCERGEAHGRALLGAIHKTIKLYADLFEMPRRRLFREVERIRKQVVRFCPEYAQEIEAIAKGAGVDARWIYALNGRSELMTLPVGECTAVMIPGRLLAQNWDWFHKAAELLVVLRIEREDGHRILTLTEPGMITKIGLNSAGLGVGLNFLWAHEVRRGLPQHILMRAVLDSRSMEEAKARLERAGLGQSLSLMIGSGAGQALHLELGPHDRYELPPTSTGVYLHTNHYLAREELAEDQALLENSRARYQRALELSRDDATPRARVERILFDQKDRQHPILVPKGLHGDHPLLGSVCTACTIILDLHRQQMFVRRPPRGGFARYEC